MAVGPQIDLLMVKTSFGDHVRAVSDAAGRVHVLIAAHETKTVHDVVVGPDGSVSRAVIQKDLDADSIDGTIDERGRLHVVADFRYFVRDGDTWQESTRTPWADAGVDIERSMFLVLRPRFVRGAPNPIWVFEMKGGSVGAEGRMDWFGFGNAMGGVIWPWWTHGVKTVLVSDGDGATTWTVLERQDKHDAIAPCPAADRAGNVYLVYSKVRQFLGADIGEPMFLRLDAKDLTASAVDADDPGVQKVGKLRLRSAAGSGLTQDVLKLMQSRGLYSYNTLEHLTTIGCPAADPDGQSVLLPEQILWQSGSLSLTNQFPDWTDRPGEIKWRTSAAGNATYHGLTAYWRFKPGLFFDLEARFVYGRLVGTMWETAELGLSPKDMFDIASTGPDKAFVVWATNTGYVGHWISSGKGKQ